MTTIILLVTVCLIGMHGSKERMEGQPWPMS